MSGSQAVCIWLVNFHGTAARGTAARLPIKLSFAYVLQSSGLSKHLDPPNTASENREGFKGSTLAKSKMVKRWRNEAHQAGSTLAMTLRSLS